MDWNSLISAVVGALIGGLIAAVSTFWAAAWGARRAFQYSKTLQDEAEREATRRLLLAIRAEVETIWSGYQLEVGHYLAALKPGQGLDLVYKLRQQYFTVYDTNAQFLGHVESDELRAAIVRTYTFAKGLIDSHLLNNDLLAYHKQMKHVELGTGVFAAGAEGFKQKALNEWRDFGVEIKAAYEQTKESVDELLRLLRESEAIKPD